jgi:crotonobetainyl-CoA:carnitine CoA-transferase CaiB-like acyl-CoA transferase
LQVAHPVKFSVSEHKPTGAAPELGADTEAVLAGLGLSAEDLAALTTSGGSSE